MELPGELEGPKSGTEFLEPIKPYFGVIITAAIIVAGIAFEKTHVPTSDVVVGGIAVVLMLAVGLLAGNLAYRFLILREQRLLHSALKKDEAVFRGSIHTEVANIEARFRALEVTINNIPALPHWSEKSAIVDLLNQHVLRTDEEVALFEATVDCDEIWVITRDLHKDVPSGTGPAHVSATFEPIVEANIRERRIKYVYLLPKKPANELTVARNLIPKFRDCPELLEVHIVGDAEWTQLPYRAGDFGIYFFDREEHSMSAQFEIPWTERKLWIQLDATHARNWAGEVYRIIEQSRDSHAVS
jgi:hypothetical protein